MSMLIFYWVSSPETPLSWPLGYGQHPDKPTRQRVKYMMDGAPALQPYNSGSEFPGQPLSIDPPWGLPNLLELY